MITIEDSATEVRELLTKEMPKAKVARIDVNSRSDSDGEPSLYVRIVFKTKPVKPDLKKTHLIIDEFRTWLTNNGDSRFPYFSFLTIEDEKEMSAKKH
jgi:hypothetical protein